MAIYDIDVNTITPKANSVILSNQTTIPISFEINGDSVYSFRIYFYAYVFSNSGDKYTYSWQQIGFKSGGNGSGTCFKDKEIVNTSVDINNLSQYVGEKISFRIDQISIPTPVTYQNDSSSPKSFYYYQQNFEISSGDYGRVLLSDAIDSSGYTGYFHLYGGTISGQKTYIRFYYESYSNAKQNSIIGSASNAFSFFSENVPYWVVKDVYSPRISLTLVSSVPEIDLVTTYTDQTLTFYAGDNYYLCKNSQINLHFTLSGINSVITKYRVLLYSAQYGPVSGFEPTYTGEWIYNQDMYYQVSGQLNNSNLYIAVEAYDNLGVHYTTTRQQYSSDQYQYALAISFDYTQYVPTPSIGCTATYDCINGRDIITLDGLNALYGQVNTFATYGSSNYTQVSNFGSTGNTAISISDTNSILYYPETTSTGVPLYYIAPTGANCFPMFLWQTPNGTFSNASPLFTFTSGSSYMTVYMENNHIYRTTNAGIDTVGIETVDDGLFYPAPNVIYLVAITDTRVVFRPFIYTAHNKLNFGLVAGQNVL